MTNDSSKGRAPVRVLFCCTGVGIFNRGIETFFREAFDGLKTAEGIEARLIVGKAQSEEKRVAARNEVPKAAGTERNRSTYSELSGTKVRFSEHVVWCLPRTGRFAQIIGRLMGRSAYAVEQWSSFFGVVLDIRRFRPDVVFTSEANLMFLLRRFRRGIGVPFRVLYSNGGPVHPPFERHDVVQQVAPLYRDEALATGEPPERHILVPYGIQVPSAPILDAEAKRMLRLKLGLPLHRPIILSVGWIARQHKRMDYIISEVAQINEMLQQTTYSANRRASKNLVENAPFLQLLGAMDESTPEVLRQAERQLGADHYSAKSVRPDQVADYYRAADIFVLGSLAEGFGRVYLEALMHGLPTIGHRHPVIEYVLGDVGIVADLSRPGVLAAVLLEELGKSEAPPAIFGENHLAQGTNSSTWPAAPISHGSMETDALRLRTASEALRRWSSVRDRFGWDVLRAQYAEMFRRAARSPLPHSGSESVRG